jgi:hypothetical protein
MTNNTKQQDNWEKEFFDRFAAVKVYNRQEPSFIYRKVFADRLNLPFEVLDFIRTLLAEQRQQIKTELLADCAKNENEEGRLLVERYFYEK